MKLSFVFRFVFVDSSRILAHCMRLMAGANLAQNLVDSGDFAHHYPWVKHEYFILNHAQLQEGLAGPQSAVRPDDACSFA